MAAGSSATSRVWVGTWIKVVLEPSIGRTLLLENCETIHTIGGELKFVDEVLEISGLEGGTMEEGFDEELFCRGVIGLAFEMAAKASAAWVTWMCILALLVLFNSIQKPRNLSYGEELVDEPRALHDWPARLLMDRYWLSTRTK